MEVNVAKTKKKLLESGRRVGPWAKTKGLSPDALRMYLNGRYVPTPGGQFEAKVVKALEEDGLLVLRRTRRGCGDA